MDHVEYKFVEYKFIEYKFIISSSFSKLVKGNSQGIAHILTINQQTKVCRVLCVCVI